MKKQNRVVFFNMLSSILLKGISIFTSPVFSRLLGTAGYGVVKTYTTWVGIFAIAGTLQTHGTLINARVEYPEEEQKRYHSSVMFLSMVFFGCACCLLLLFREPLSRVLRLDGLLMGLLCFQAFGTFCNNFLHNRFTYEMKAGRNMILSLGTTLAVFGLSLALVLLMPGETNYYGRIFGMALVYGGMGLVICCYTLWRGRTFYHREYWKFCLTLALPVMLYNLSDLLLGNSDLVMLRAILGDDTAGIYGYAFTFGGVMFTLYAALNNSWVPFYFEDMKHDRQASLRQQAVNFLEVFTVLSMGFLLLSREVFHVYARRDFWPGTELIPCFVGSYYLNFLCTFPVNFEYYHKKVKVVSAATILCSLINVALNWVLIHRIGMFGAAVATMLSHCIQLTMHYLYCRYKLGKTDYPFGISLWGKYALAFLASAALFYLLPSAWYIRWPLGAAIGLWELLRVKRRKRLL